jgi:hypothetical protein|tara:strand:- start:75 stop:587 length:513 start_codon:yes stop_codon:yes gene_type:complete
MNEVKVIDNFLLQEDFDTLSKVVKGYEFPWYIANTSDYPGDNNYQLFHILYNNNVSYSNYFERFQTLYDNLKIFSLFKVRLIATMKDNGKSNIYHTDLENVRMKNAHLKTAVYYFNSNNGGTQFEYDNQIIQSVENRMVIFPFQYKHRTVKHTAGDEFRYVLNLNYIEQC